MLILICVSFFISLGGSAFVEYFALFFCVFILTKKHMCSLLIATGLAPTSGITPTRATLTRMWWKTILPC